MASVGITFNLPDSLFAEASEAGLLSPIEIERLVREALRAKRVARLAVARDQLAVDPLPPMTTEEIQAEIRSYRDHGF